MTTTNSILTAATVSSPCEGCSTETTVQFVRRRRLTARGCERLIRRGCEETGYAARPNCTVTRIEHAVIEG